MGSLPATNLKYEIIVTNIILTTTVVELALTSLQECGGSVCSIHSLTCVTSKSLRVLSNEYVFFQTFSYKEKWEGTVDLGSGHFAIVLTYTEKKNKLDLLNEFN